jgi:hypothetical protein
MGRLNSLPIIDSVHFFGSIHMYKIRQPLALLALLVTVIALTAVPTLQAQTPTNSHNFALQAVSADGTSIIPYFVLDGTAGGQTTRQVQIVNQGDSAGSVQLYTVDAATGHIGGTVLKMREDTPTETGGWIQLERDTITLAPGEGQLISFVVNVPAGARSGQHVGGIVMEPLDEDAEVQTQSQDEVSFQVDVKTRTAVAVQVNLPGTPIEQLDVLGITLGGHDSRQIMYLNLRNSGTQMVKTTGSLRIVDDQGQQLQNIRFNIGTFLPEDEINYPVHIVGEALAAGNYTADLSLRYGDTAQIYRNELAFDISQADNVQIFEGREALASPLASQTNQLVSGRPAWETMAIAGLGLLLTSFVVYLTVSIYQYERERKLRKQKLAQQQMTKQRANRQQRPLPTKQPIRARSGR